MTGSKIVCDAVANCAVKGPLGPVKVDRKAPLISIPLPATSTNPAVPVGTPTAVPTYLLNQPEKLTFSCNDDVPNGSGVALCGNANERLPSGVTVARAQNATLDTTQIGLHTV